MMLRQPVPLREVNYLVWKVPEVSTFSSDHTRYKWIDARKKENISHNC